MKNEVFNELKDKIIPFWLDLRDDEYGGFYGYVSYDLNVQKDAPKGSIYISRILWFFSESYLALGNDNEELLKSAAHAYEFLRSSLLDNKHGGVYWTVDYKGKPLDTTKHVYANAFAIYALSAYFKASRDRNAHLLAYELYELIENKCRDEFGFGEAYDRNFTPMINDKLSENGIIAEKTMNTLLHVFEGYSGLYEAHPNLGVEVSMRRILDVFKAQVYNKKLRRQDVFFDRQMRCIIDLQSYGHDIESSWLIDWGTALLGDDELMNEVCEITKDLAESVMERAFHNSYLWNEREKGKEDKTPIWWVQAEAILGFLNHYRKTGDTEYKKAAENIWGYIKTNIIDKRQNGEWFYKLDEFGEPDTDEPMAGIWKCPYHNGRMCLNIHTWIGDDT